MLLLTILFSVVLCLFLYSLRTDKGKHTKYARTQDRAVTPSSRTSEKLKTTANRSTPTVA